MICARVSHWVLFQIGSSLLLTYPHLPLHFLFFGIRRCSRWIFYFPFPSFRCLHFFKEPCFLWKMVFESPNLDASLAYCCHLVTASKVSQCPELKNRHIYTNQWKQTYLNLFLICLIVYIFLNEFMLGGKFLEIFVCEKVGIFNFALDW